MDSSILIKKGSKRCCVAGCDNDQRRTEELVVKGHVVQLAWHRVPRPSSEANTKKRKRWVEMIAKGRQDFNPGNETFVCSNHFLDGMPTLNHPYPTLFLTAREKDSSPPRTRKVPTKRNNERYESPPILPTSPESSPHFNTLNAHSSMLFCHFTREADVKFYTGLPSTRHFRIIFDHVQHKASRMSYWRGPKRSSQAFEGKRTGPERKLSIEQEFLLSLMKLRLGLFNIDLAFRFKVSDSVVSEVLLSWFKLLARELSCLIIWPSRGQINVTLPQCFKRHYKSVRVIIDCTEIFIEKPSSLLAQKKTWSEYKQHCTIKILICITPSGAISWLSPVYGGRSSDVTIVRDSGFLKLLDPFDQVMADRGFKIKTDLAARQCTLAVPPSAAKGVQMIAKDVQMTSRIANVRIHVERAIKRFKEYNIFSSHLPLQLAPVYSDMIIICAALTNLKPPLVE